MLKSFYIESVAWSLLDDIVGSKTRLKIPLKICLIILLLMTVLVTMSTITQEETPSMLVMSHTLTMMIPSLFSLVFLMQWFSKKRNLRIKKLNNSNNSSAISKLVTSYTVLLKMLNSISDKFWYSDNVDCDVGHVWNLCLNHQQLQYSGWTSLLDHVQYQLCCQCHPLPLSSYHFNTNQLQEKPCKYNIVMVKEETTGHYSFGYRDATWKI